ncbi:MAG: ATP synthase F1 subunit delta [Peptococcaceae bacterium]|nr:ATP synthase F1 subunit delta [Peptococcaceae bacterium]
MLNGALARRYARALFELATQMEVLDQIDAEMKGFTALLAENQEVRTILNHPNIGLSDKKAIVEKIGADFSRITLSFFYLLIESRRQNLLGLVGREFARMADTARGIIEVCLTSATALTAQQEESLQKAMETQTGGTVRLILVVDPALIGGARLQIGDTVMDGSVRTALDKMRNDLRKVSI